MVAAVLSRLLKDDAQLAAKMGEMATPTLTNWNGINVGSLRPVEALALN
jgi:L-asparaginase II